MPPILLIEDNENNAYLARYLLEQAGLSVHIVSTGEQGLTFMRQQTPSLVLLDIQLPGLDGYQIAAVMQQDEALRAIPIIALSSFAMPAEKKKALELGCKGYIEKPIQPLKFVEQVRRFLPPP